MSLIYPEPQAAPQYTLLCVPLELAPIVGGLFASLEPRTAWKTDQDWQKGYRAFVSLQDELMAGCLDKLIAELRAARGVRPEYTATPEADRTIGMYYSLGDLVTSSQNALLTSIFHVLDNGINGTFYANEFESNTAIRNQLADLIAIGNDQKTIQTNMFTDLESIDGKLT